MRGRVKLVALIAPAAAIVALTIFAGSALADTAGVSAVMPLDNGGFSADFSVTRDCAGGSECHFTPVVTTVPNGESCGPATSPSLPGGWVAWVGPPSQGAANVSGQGVFFSGAEGPFTFCVWAYSWPQYRLVATIANTEGRGGLGALSTGAAVELMPARVGHAAGKGRFVTFRRYTGIKRAGLTDATFSALLAATAGRWGLRDAGPTRRRPGVRDGVNSVGFSVRLDDDVLAEVTEFVERSWGRRAKRCRTVGRRNGRQVRRCTDGGRYVRATKLREIDVSLNQFVNWNFRLGQPRGAEFDFESVLLHAFGRYAGNPRARGCADSPLVEVVTGGDWWRGPGDWQRAGCGGAGVQSDSTQAVASASKARIVLRRVSLSGR